MYKTPPTVVTWRNGYTRWRPLGACSLGQVNTHLSLELKEARYVVQQATHDTWRCSVHPFRCRQSWNSLRNINRIFLNPWFSVISLIPTCWKKTGFEKTSSFEFKAKLSLAGNSNFSNISVAHCPDHLIGQSVLETNFLIGHKNSRTLDLQKTKSVVVNKTGKVKGHITYKQSWTSCRKMASDHEFTFASAIERTKKMHSAFWPCTIHGHLLQPKHGASAVQMHWSTCLLRWTEAWILLGNNGRLVRCTMKTMGHETVLFIGPRSWGGLNNRSFGIWSFRDFNRSMTGDRRKCASLNTTFFCPIERVTMPTFSPVNLMSSNTRRRLKMIAIIFCY